MIWLTFSKNPVQKDRIHMREVFVQGSVVHSKKIVYSKRLINDKFTFSQEF